MTTWVGVVVGVVVGEGEGAAGQGTNTKSECKAENKIHPTTRLYYTQSGSYVLGQ